MHSFALSALLTNHAAHHELYEKAGILHRDISINNLMIDSEHPDIGVLIDLDFAVRDRDPDTGVRFVLPPMPGGTVPFRSIDLSTKDPLPRSLYRHDLESFFWTLLWILFYKTGDSVDEIFAPLSVGQWKEIWTRKYGFLVGSTGEILTKDLPLRKAWIKPLWKAFRDGYNAVPVEHGGPSTSSSCSQELGDFDDETLGNRITYDRFMRILKA